MIRSRRGPWREPACARPRRGCRGFSLVELLVALALVLVLTQLVSGIFQAPVNQAREMVLHSNLRAMRRALRDFYNDHGRYPYNGQDEYGNVVAFLDPNTSEVVNGVHDGLGRFPSKRTRYLQSIPGDPTLTDPLPIWSIEPFNNDDDVSPLTGEPAYDEDPFGGGDLDGDGQFDEDPPDVKNVKSTNPEYQEL